MKKGTLLLAVVLMAVAVCSSAALALPPMGPPTATLGEGQFSVGVEYGYTDMEPEYSFKGTGTATDTVPVPPYSETDKGTVDVFKSSMFFGTIGYGLTDNWEAFVRLGAADLELEDWEGGYGFAWGAGTKLTFAQEGDVTWGALFQWTWFNPGDDDITYADVILGVPVSISGESEVDWWEIQVAVGPTWQVADTVCIYGGPFLHFVDGKYDEKASGAMEVGTPPVTYNLSWKASADVEQDSMFGGYVGAQWDVVENASLYAECQFTGDAWGLGIGGIWRIP